MPTPTYNDYTGDGSNTFFAINFEYLEDEHVTVAVDGVNTSNFTINTDQPTKRVEMTTAPGNGANVRVRRKSQRDIDLVDFENGSVLTESELDRAYRHNRYLHQEIGELNDASLQKAEGSTAWDAKGERIVNVGIPSGASDATTKSYVDSAISAINQDTGNPPNFSKFTGDGIETDFTLTFSSNVTTSAAFLVTIDGGVIDPDDYTIVGLSNEIRFDSPPANTKEILVIERGYKTAITDVPTDFDYGSIVGDPVTASYSYGGIA